MEIETLPPGGRRRGKIKRAGFTYRIKDELKLNKHASGFRSRIVTERIQYKTGVRARERDTTKIPRSTNIFFLRVPGDFGGKSQAFSGSGCRVKGELILNRRAPRASIESSRNDVERAGDKETREANKGRRKKEKAGERERD